MAKLWVGLALIGAGAAGLPSLYERMGWLMSPQLGSLLQAALLASIIGGVVLIVYGIGERLNHFRKEWIMEVRLYRRNRPHPDQWLRNLANFDLARPGWSLRAIDYQVDMTGLSETPSWVDFSVRVFNGAVYTMKVIDVEGQIYCDDQGKLIPLTPPPSLASAVDSARRGDEFTLVLRQAVTPSMQAALLRDDPKGGSVIRGFSLSQIGLRLKPEPVDNTNTRSVLEHPFRDIIPSGHPFRVIGR